MQEDLLVALPDYKIYKDRAIYYATFLGGPVVATYLIAHNYKALGEKNKLWKTWVIGVLSTIVIFALAFLISDSKRIPTIILPIIYSTMASLLVGRLQGKRIKLHGQSGGQYYSTGRAIVISIIGAVISLVILLLLQNAFDIYKVMN